MGKMNDLALQADMRAKVFALEDAMLATEGHVTELPTIHHFAPGIYAREIKIPAGTTLTGKIHKYPQLNILSEGDISVLTEDGIKRVQAPFTVVSPGGTKRVAYAHTDCTWTTVHQTHETDLAKIEDHFIAETEADYARFCEPEQILCLG